MNLRCDVYITSGAEIHGDLEHVYELLQARNGQLIIKAHNVDYVKEDGEYKQNLNVFFYGRLKEFVSKYGDDEAKSKWDELVPSPNKVYDEEDVERRMYERLKQKFEPSL